MKIVTPGSHQLDAAFDLLTRVFIDSSPPHQALNISLAEYRDYLAPSFFSMAQRGLTLLAVDNCDNLLGCVIAGDYHASVDAATDEQCQRLAGFRKMAPLRALLAALECEYLKHTTVVPGVTMLVDMAAVAPRARAQGVYLSLRSQLHGCGREAGFSKVAGELSSAATQHVCVNRFGHRVIAEITYRQFQFNGARPFAQLQDPTSIVMVEGAL